MKFRSVDRAGNIEDVRELVVDDAPNDRQLAAPIEDKANLKRLIDPAGDEDWFRFDVPERSNAKISLIALPADYDLELRSESGDLLAAPRERGKRSEEIDTTLDPGRYYLHVLGVDGAFDAKHPYELKLKLEPATR